MRKKLLKAAVKAAPLVLGAAPTTRDLRVAAVERAARRATGRVRDRAGRGDETEADDEGDVEETTGGDTAARERLRARMKKAASPAARSGLAGKAAKGLAAAVVALPLGLWVGSRLRDRG